MDFMALLAQLQNPGDEGPPETIYDDLTAAYNSDLGVRDAAVSEKDLALQAALAEIQSLKAHNYELLMLTKAGESDGEEQNTDGDDNDTDNDDDTEQGIDSLFGDDDDDNGKD